MKTKKPKATSIPSSLIATLLFCLLALSPYALAQGDLDTDGDGLSDTAEAAAGTDPDNPDTDGVLKGFCVRKATRKLQLQTKG